jgi:NAD(P)-dependent dehydrogenase (short-subunit alcohol dehydrogenase family)
VTGIQGRTALVTGGGRGLGRAIALVLAEAGARVTVLARSRDEVEAVAREVAGRALAGDVRDPSLLAALGDVDVLVNNAGVVWPLGRTAQADPDEWARAVDINLVGAFRVTRAVLPGMLTRAWGRIVNVTSGAAAPPGMPSASAYSVSKAGLEMLTLTLAKECGGTGVTVNAVRPGVVETPMQEYMRALPRDLVGEEFHSRFHGLHERGELLDPALPARLVVRLVQTDRSGEVVDTRERSGQELLRG